MYTLLLHIQRYICHTMNAMQGPYAVVWMHTHATYFENCPSISWLWSTYER